MIYFNRYVHNKSSKSTRILRLHYDELIGKIEDNEGKKYFVVGDYMLDVVLDKIKQIISIEKFDNTKILIDTDDNFCHYFEKIYLKNMLYFKKYCNIINMCYKKYW